MVPVPRQDAMVSSIRNLGVRGRDEAVAATNMHSGAHATKKKKDFLIITRFLFKKFRTVELESNDVG